MINFRGHPRVAAVVMLLIGAGLMVINHVTITHEHKYYMVSLFLAPAVILFGIVGLIAPGILSQGGGIQTGTQSALVKAVGLLIFLFGMGVGWAIAHFYYGIF